MDVNRIDPTEARALLESEQAAQEDATFPRVKKEIGPVKDPRVFDTTAALWLEWQVFQIE